MYYGTIADEQVKIFHKNVKLTASYTELNGLGSGALFDKTKTNKVIPKFYSDKITGNDNVTIIEDLLVIYMNNNDLNSLYFTGKNDNFTFAIQRWSIHGLSNNFLELHFYDVESLFSLSNFHFHIKENIVNGVDDDFVTDDYGNILVKFASWTGSFTITCLENGQSVVLNK